MANRDAFTLCLIGISVDRSFNEITSRIMGPSLLVNIFRHFWGFMEYGGLHICQIYISVKSRASLYLRESSLWQSLCSDSESLPIILPDPEAGAVSGACLGARAQEGKCLKDYLHTSDIINGSVHAGVQGRDQAGAPRWVSLSSVAGPGLREAELCEENTCETMIQPPNDLARPLPRVSVSGSGMSCLACGDNNHGITIIPAHFIMHRGPGAADRLTGV